MLRLGPGGEGEALGLFHGQGVHVGAQGNGGTRQSAPQHPDHAGPGDPGAHLDAQRLGRLPIDDPTVKREILREEPLVVALPIGHPLLERPSLPRLVSLVGEPLILYPREPCPSYADQVLALFRACGLEPRSVQEVSGVQTALDLVAAGEGIGIVPEALQRLRREDVLYRYLDEERAVSPVVMLCRRHDSSREITMLLDLIRELYVGKNGAGEQPPPVGP